MTLLDLAHVILTLDAAAHSLAPRSCRILDSIYAKEEVRSHLVILWDIEWDECGDLAEQVA